ncbi:MAG: quinolinate synthase NadA [Planctomycetes bacterium]|jgi:quinolinate synthase|nr:quinolinate synthase NadA [Planctomycetota bacterium]
MVVQKLIDQIRVLKAERRAVLLAHNYQPPEIQDLADFCGDSLGLSLQASKTDAEVIVFCGVRFMAETAKILSPGKTVLLPDRTAGCPMAEMITAGQLRELKDRHPDALVVCYVNSTAEVKAESDYCCTSANAVAVVQSLPRDRPVIFVPDQHLGRFVAQRTGRDLILWPGYCPTHAYISEDDIRRAREQHPDAVVIAHPECSEPVKDLADALLSTGQMIKFVRTSPAPCFIVATEVGMIHPLKKARPDAEYIPAGSRGVCPNMKKITLEKVLTSLADRQYPIEVPEEIRRRAERALQRMVAILPEK